ncbi:MAG: PDZ domain-containing protein [bacterium]|nr:PDZ domain-containing protein [bacterium]
MMDKPLVPVLPRLAGLLALLLLAAGFPGLPAAAGAQQEIEQEDLIEEEDLAETELEPAAPAPVDDAELVTLFAAAEGVFYSEDPSASLALFDDVVGRLEAQLESSGLTEVGRSLLARSLNHRAALAFQFGETEIVESNLVRLVEIEPGYGIDSETAPPDLVREFDRLRRRMVGELMLTVVEPSDLELRIDDRRIDALPGSVAALAGTRVIEAQRLGYAPLALEVEITAGKETSLEVVLERVAALIRVITRPTGCKVTIDGTLRGTTEGIAPEDLLPEGAARIYGREEFSAELVILGVEPGLRVLEIHKEGHRPHRAELIINELIDYNRPPIVLEQQRGILVFRDFPAGSTIRIDGEITRPDNPQAPQLSLAPGEHELIVSQGPLRMFETRLRLADRQTVEVNVRLRPGLALLGVLGGDQDTARNLDQSLRLALAESGKWALMDRTAIAPGVLAELGLSPERLRAAAGNGAVEVDWKAVQAAVDERAPGLVYLAAVLSDDLVARSADVWIWAAAPGPARPDRVRITLGQPNDIARIKEYFDSTLLLRRPWVGALVIDSRAAPHPVVAHVTPGGPLAQAGVAVGDQVVAVSQVPVFNRADFDARVAVAETGETVEIGLQSPGGTRSVRVTLGTSPLLLSRNTPDLLDAIAFTELVLMEEEAGADALWVIRLNQALILMHAHQWEQAVRRLRDVGAPQAAHGLGRATVDYWLGVALQGAGPSYRRDAAEAFARAAEVTGARLFHHDSAWVAPRARARLRALGVEGGA